MYLWQNRCRQASLSFNTDTKENNIRGTILHSESRNELFYFILVKQE